MTASTASASLATSGLDVDGRGTGRVTGDTLSLDITWTLRSRSCGGTMHLHGETANMGSAIIGELRYVDGCEGGETKGGTFSVWKSGHRESVMAP